MGKMLSTSMVPDDAADPTRKPGRPKRAAPAGNARPAPEPIFQKTPVDCQAALKRLKQGRQDADIDLLVTDCGPLDPAVATYEMGLLAGDIPVDITMLAYVPKRSLDCVMETLHA